MKRWKWCGQLVRRMLRPKGGGEERCGCRKDEQKAGGRAMEEQWKAVVKEDKRRKSSEER